MDWESVDAPASHSSVDKCPRIWQGPHPGINQPAKRLIKIIHQYFCYYARPLNDVHALCAAWQVSRGRRMPVREREADCSCHISQGPLGGPYIL